MFDKNNEKQNLILIDRSNRLYFSGVDIAEGLLLLSKDLKVYFTDARYFSALDKSLKDSEIECRLIEDSNTLLNYLRANKIKELYADFGNISHSEYLWLKSAVKKIKDGKDCIFSKRSVKSEKELKSIEKACEIAQKCYHECIYKLEVGMTEVEFKNILESKMIELGASEMGFDTIVAFSANTAVPHHVSGQTALEKDVPVLVDMGCKVNGYCSDITRMAYKGTPSKKFIECYQAVLQANRIAEEKIYSGISGILADGISREYLKELNLDKKFTHSLGHGIGLDIHEFPRLSLKSEDVLIDGMVFSIEPGVYFDGEFGIRIEDTVVLENGKVKRLFNDEKNLIIL